MKKNVFFALLLTIAVTAFFASCFKETEPVATPVQTEDNTLPEDGVSDRGACSKLVTITGGIDLQLCGNIPYYPGSNCAGCTLPGSYGTFVLEYNQQTVTMIDYCFSLTNPTATTKNVSFRVGKGICPLFPSTPIPPGATVSFCISQQGSCCRANVVSCD
ncbi:MAG: hypothetical protein IPK76_21395 [Lewinellaceae bacterium]|jgi:hypothetical protein|nr:hypothetical protein [Lewinellaceae bacterium]